MPIDAKLCNEQWIRYQYVRDRGHLPFLEKAQKCEQFFAGEQWEPSDLEALRLQKRPALTINKILSTLSTVMGEQIYNRSEVLFRPQGDSPDDVAETLTKVWMQIAQDNQLPWVRSDMFADGVIRSRGFLDVRMDFEDSMEGVIKITNLNSKNVIIDPDAEEYDPDYWNDVFTTKWCTPQDIEVLYTKEDAKLLQDRDGSAYPYGYDSVERVRDRFGGNQLLAGYYGILDPYHVRRNVRVIERQYRRIDKQIHFVDVKTGDMRPIPSEWDRNRIAALIEKAQGEVSTTQKTVKRIRWTVTADNVLLHDDWSPYTHFTVIPYFPHFRYGKTIGLVENLIGSQELLNKTSSQELHVINTTANSGWKVKAGALVNMSIEDLENAGATTGIVLELNDINGAEKITPNATPQGLDRVSYKAEEHIKSISGVSDSMQGFDRADVAAKAIQTKRQQGSQNMSKVMDNLERTDYLLARNVLDLIQNYYTEERIIHITHDDVSNKSEKVTVNQQDPVTGEITNDLTLGEYDIVISSQPYRASLEDSQFDQLIAMREQGVKFPDSILIENSRLSRKAEIAKEMMAAQNSPEAQQQSQLNIRRLTAECSLIEAQAFEKQADSKLKNAKTEKEMAMIPVEQQAARHTQLMDIHSQMNPEGGGQPDPQMQAQQKREELIAAHKLKMEQMREQAKMQRDNDERDFELKQRVAHHDAGVTRASAEHDARVKEAEAFRDGSDNDGDESDNDAKLELERMKLEHEDKVQEREMKFKADEAEKDRKLQLELADKQVASAEKIAKEKPKPAAPKK